MQTETRTIEFDTPVPGGGTRRESGKVIEELPNNRFRVEIMVGGDPTYRIVTPANGNGHAPKQAKAPRKEKKAAAGNPQPDLFSSAIEALKEKVAELEARIPPPPKISGGDDPYGDDITPETVIEPIMYREDILGPRPKYRTLQRHHVGDSRYYVQQFELEGGRWSPPELYSGVTSVCKSVMPRSKFLEQWLCGFATYDDAMRALNLSSAKGTVMHHLFALCMNDELPRDFGSSEFDRIVRHSIARQLEGIGVSVEEVFGEWKAFLCKALLGFKQFIYDYKVEVLAVEIVLGDRHQYFDGDSKPLYGYFAQVDLLCYLTIEVDGLDHENPYKTGPRAGKPREVKVEKRVLAIVDFKSGDGDYPEHDMQLELQIPLVRKAFPHLKEEIRIYNWHPSDYKTSALARKNGNGEECEFGYRLLDKTGKNPREWADDHLWIWRKYHARELPMKMVFQGDPNIGTPPKENVRFVEYPVYWEEKATIAGRRGFIEA
jgi:hypothetical protein